MCTANPCHFPHKSQQRNTFQEVSIKHYIHISDYYFIKNRWLIIEKNVFCEEHNKI